MLRAELASVRVVIIHCGASDDRILERARGELLKIAQGRLDALQVRQRRQNAQYDSREHTNHNRNPKGVAFWRDRLAKALARGEVDDARDLANMLPALP